MRNDALLFPHAICSYLKLQNCVIKRMEILWKANKYLWIPWSAINKVHFECQWDREFNLHTEKEVVVAYSVVMNLSLRKIDSLPLSTSTAWKYIIVSHYGFLSRPLGIAALRLPNRLHRLLGSRDEWVDPRIFICVAVLCPRTQGCVRHHSLLGNTSSHIAWFQGHHSHHSHEWCPWDCAVCSSHVHTCDFSSHLAGWV